MLVIGVRLPPDQFWSQSFEYGMMPTAQIYVNSSAPREAPTLMNPAGNAEAAKVAGSRYGGSPKSWLIQLAYLPYGQDEADLEGLLERRHQGNTMWTSEHMENSDANP